MNVVSQTVAPRISYDDKLKEEQSLKAGQTLILSVNTSGVPIPSISWYLNDAELTVGNGTSIETTDTYSTLTIKGTTAANSGPYKVTATNIVDSVSADFTVVIKGQLKCFYFNTLWNFLFVFAYILICAFQLGP